MPVGDVQAYANLSAQQLGQINDQQNANADQATDDALKHALKKMQLKGDEQKRSDGISSSGTPVAGSKVEGKLEQKVQAIFKDLTDGKSGPSGKNAVETFKQAALSKLTNNQSKEAFGEATQKTPQAGFAAASSFQRSSNLPGADRAMGQTPIASEALVVTTQAASQGEKQLKQVEEAIGGFVEAFSNDDASPTVKKKVFDKTVKNPGSESTKAAMDWGKSKQMKLQNGPAQEAMANLLSKADPNDPKKFKEAMKSLENLAQNPKLLSPKLNGQDMKFNFSNITKAVTGGEKLSVSLEAQEKLLKTSKFHAMGAEARGKIQLVVGKAPQMADKVAQSMAGIRDSRLPSFAQKLATRGMTPETLQQITGDCKKREIAFPAIEPFDPNDASPKQRAIAFKAKWNRVAQQVDKHNAGIAKSLNKCKSLKDFNELDVPRGFGPVLNGAKTPQELATKSGCSLEEAGYIFELSGRCEEYKNSDLQLSKNMSTKRRSLRGKPEARTHLKDKRTSVTGLPRKTTIVLSDEEQSASSSEFRRLVGSGTSKTPPVVSEDSANATSVAAEVAPTAEEIAQRNTQTVRPGGTSLTVGGRNKGWGANAVAVGMDAETAKKKLAKLREDKATTLKNDPTRLTRGPSIGRASDFQPLSDIVAAKTSWVKLSPAVKAAMRNLQLTPNILESWYAGDKRVYSSLQGKGWGDMTEIQQKSAQLLGLQQENWDALASVLSASKKPQAELRKAPTKHDVNTVQMKSRA